MSATTVRFLNHERSFSSQREAYEWFLNSLIKKRPDILEDQRKLDYISQGYGRRFLDRNWKNLWGKSRHLAAEGHGRHYIKLLGGWYANINLSEDAKLGVLRRFAEIAGFKEGTDWSWVTVERRTRPAAARLARDLRRPDFVVPELDLESV
jgi:hypothetical protein